jgi:hypothetical protein
MMFFSSSLVILDFKKLAATGWDPNEQEVIPCVRLKSKTCPYDGGGNET